MVESFRKIYKVEGVHGFFKGLLASCIKEGTFAGIYYALYTEGKKLGLSSMISGMGSGILIFICAWMIVHNLVYIG